MNKILKYFFISTSILFLSACKSFKNQSIETDDKSYISDFELIQRNIRNDSIIRINSPKAIINQITNDFEIFDSSIELSNTIDNKLQINSGRSTLNNSQNIIKVFNNVNINLQNNPSSFIRTQSLSWNLGRSLISLTSPLELNLKNTKIISESGLYNIDTNQLKLNNNIFTRSVNNINGLNNYQIEIVSDVALWSKDNNLLEFKSNEKQVESTINFLGTE